MVLSIGAPWAAVFPDRFLHIAVVMFVTAIGNSQGFKTVTQLLAVIFSQSSIGGRNWSQRCAAR